MGNRAGIGGSGKARLSADLTSQTGAVSGQQVTTTPPAKSGVEIVRDKEHLTHAEAEASEHIRVIDHDNNEVLFSGTPAQFKALKRALAEG